MEVGDRVWLYWDSTCPRAFLPKGSSGIVCAVGYAYVEVSFPGHRGVFWFLHRELSIVPIAPKELRTRFDHILFQDLP